MLGTKIRGSASPAPERPSTSKTLVWTFNFNLNHQRLFERRVQRHDASPKLPLGWADSPVDPQQAGAQQHATGVMQAPVFHSGSSTTRWYVTLLLLLLHSWVQSLVFHVSLWLCMMWTLFMLGIGVNGGLNVLRCHHASPVCLQSPTMYRVVLESLHNP